MSTFLKRPLFPLCSGLSSDISTLIIYPHGESQSVILLPCSFSDHGKWSQTGGKNMLFVLKLIISYKKMCRQCYPREHKKGGNK